MKSFFNPRKSRGFNHKPIYWNPEKEALENRVKKAKREMGQLPEEDYDTSQIRGSFIDQTSHVRRRTEHEEKSSTSRNITLAIILVVLMIGFYYFYLR